MGFNTENVFHRYGKPPAIITATFASGGRLKTYVGPEGALHAVLLDSSGRIIKSRASAIESGVLTRVEIMPQVAPVEAVEFLLRPEYVRRNLSSALAPRHFRNQLNILPEHLAAFRRMAEDTWSGLQVRDLNRQRTRDGTYLTLLVRNEDYVSEIASMGHGLQMWLQTMWFLARVDTSATIILDEPDVYMHPDLQRRLIRHLRAERRQVLVTTHSVEIMSEVSPEDILVLDRQHPRSSYAASFPAAQRVLDNVGSAHNLQLARLWHAKRAIFVEGKDLRILASVFDVLFPDDKDGLASIPHIPLGGWGGWQYAIGSSMLLRNAGGNEITVYCVLDSDYHTDAQKQIRRGQAANSGVQLYIWSKKEMENYLLIPSSIVRAIAEKAGDGISIPSNNDVEAALEEIASSLRDETFDGLASEILAENRSLGQGGANRAAREILDARWTTLESRLSVVSGKAALARIAAWSQERFGVSLNAGRLAASMRTPEIPNEIRDVLTAIARSTPFSA